MNGDTPPSSDGSETRFDAELDALGLLCPLPVLKARKRLQALSPGQVLLIRADDPASIVDMPHYCAESGHRLLRQADGETEGELLFWVEKTEGDASL